MLTIDNIAKTGMYTKKEVCSITGFTPRTLNNKMNAGKIKFFRRRDTGKPIFKGIDIIAFLLATLNPITHEQNSSITTSSKED